MNVLTKSKTGFACDAAKERLTSIQREPALLASWEQTVFLHYQLPPDILQPQVPPPFELELHQGAAYVSLVAITMSHFRPYQRLSPIGMVRFIRKQCFLNFRTYVRLDDEPGAFFLWGWLSQPFPLALPSMLFALPYSFASVDYEHEVQQTALAGNVSDPAGSGEFAFRAVLPRNVALEPCSAGSFDEFALDRYTGFFCRGAHPQIFRAWHPPWQQTKIEPTIEAMSLICRRFPWFDRATFADANFSPGFSEVRIGRPHRLDVGSAARAPRRRVLSAFYEMP